MKLFKREPNLADSAQTAVAEIDRLIAPFQEGRDLINEMAQLELSELDQALLARAFDEMAATMRKGLGAAMLEDAMRSLRALRDSMVDAAPKPWVN